MEFTSFSWEITSNQYPTIPQDSSVDDCFSIVFRFTKELVQITEHTNFPSTTTTVNEAFLVPSNILCNCRENTEALHETFSSVPISPEILDRILPAIGETARTFLSHEGCDSNIIMGDIFVNLYVTTRIVIEDSDFCNDDLGEDVPEPAPFVNLLERLKIDEQDDDAEQQCAICLEEFGHDSEDSRVEVVRTDCSHVFHECCIFRWFRRCADRQSPFSCPLCRRCIIFPASQIDE